MSSSPLLKPRRLYPGATLGVIAPAGHGSSEAAAAGIAWLETQGFKVELGQNALAEWGYLAGQDRARADDLHRMFASPQIDGIVCLRGGYGTMRLLDLLDYELIKAHPKVFVGYSDITALHTVFSERAGLVTFHGPMAASDMSGEIPEYTVHALLAAVTGDAVLGPIDNPPDTSSPAFIAPGTARGRLTGGNLSVLCATLGTPYEIDTTNKILCLEDVGEAPYRIDRLLTQLLLAGKLQASAGIVLGVFSGCEDDEGSGFTLAEVLQNRLAGLKVPILTNLYFGHTTNKTTLPFGVMAELDSDRGLSITETATIP